jgi:predicted RNA-binding Zn-ribbon protein involved in translation (DUF1610 family)
LSTNNASKEKQFKVGRKEAPIKVLDVNNFEGEKLSEESETETTVDILEMTPQQAKKKIAQILKERDALQAKIERLEGKGGTRVVVRGEEKDALDDYLETTKKLAVAAQFNQLLKGGGIINPQTGGMNMSQSEEFKELSRRLEGQEKVIQDLMKHLKDKAEQEVLDKRFGAVSESLQKEITSLREKLEESVKKGTTVASPEVTELSKRLEATEKLLEKSIEDKRYAELREAQDKRHAELMEIVRNTAQKGGTAEDILKIYADRDKAIAEQQAKAEAAKAESQAKLESLKEELRAKELESVRTEIAHLREEAAKGGASPDILDIYDRVSKTIDTRVDQAVAKSKSASEKSPAELATDLVKTTIDRLEKPVLAPMGEAITERIRAARGAEGAKPVSAQPSHASLDVDIVYCQKCGIPISVPKAIMDFACPQCKTVYSRQPRAPSKTPPSETEEGGEEGGEEESYGLGLKFPR